LIMPLRVSDDYIAGFVDGEGMFYIGIVPSRGSGRNRSGWQVIYFFKVSQNPSGKAVLDKIKKRLNCGYIRPNSQSDPSDKSLAYVVRDLPSLRDKVIPFFVGKLIIKRNTLDKFKKVIELVDEGNHLNKEGMKEILDIAYSMNTRKRKVAKTQILKSFKD
jgi:hypothetical protein